MNRSSLQCLKTEFHNIGLRKLGANLIDLKAEVTQLRLGIANDGKSSMGDKYETSREMMQQEINHLEKQISLTNQQIFNLKAVDLNKTFEKVAKGCIVKTSIGTFYISISLGEVSFETHSCMMISEFAPLAKLLINKNAGQSIFMNNKEVTIFELC